MRFVMTVGGQAIILNLEQAEAIINALQGAEFLDQQYVSSADGGGEDGTNYIKLLRRFETYEKLNLAPMHEDYYQARVLITKVFDDKKAKK